MYKILPVIFMALTLTACSDSGQLSDPVSLPQPSPTPPAKVSFKAFVKQTVNRPAASKPLEINDLDFEFDETDDPDAYNELFE